MRLPYKSEVQALIDTASLPVVFVTVFVAAALCIAWCLILVMMFTNDFQWNWFSLWAIVWTAFAAVWLGTSVRRVSQFLAGERDSKVLWAIMVRSLILFLSNPVAVILALWAIGGLQGKFSL